MLTGDQFRLVVRAGSRLVIKGTRAYREAFESPWHRRVDVIALAWETVRHCRS